MRINFVLVDYENVKAVDLRDLNREDVRVMVFLGSNQSKISTDLALQVQALGDRGQLIQICGNGPNALDFHIAFTIGQQCGGDAAKYFHIISNDAGFDPLITYLKGKKIPAARYKAIGDIPIVKASQPKASADRAQYFIERLSRPKATKPRTLITLTNAIRTAFNRQISDKEIDEVVAILTSRKFLAVEDGKVSYQAQG